MRYRAVSPGRGLIRKISSMWPHKTPEPAPEAPRGEVVSEYGAFNELWKQQRVFQSLGGRRVHVLPKDITYPTMKHSHIDRKGSFNVYYEEKGSKKDNWIQMFRLPSDTRVGVRIAKEPPTDERERNAEILEAWMTLYLASKGIGPPVIAVGVFEELTTYIVEAGDPLENVLQIKYKNKDLMKKLSLQLSMLFVKCSKVGPNEDIKQGVIMGDTKSGNTIVIREKIFFIDFGGDNTVILDDIKPQCVNVVNITLFCGAVFCRFVNTGVPVHTLLHDTIAMLRKINLKDFEHEICKSLMELNIHKRLEERRNMSELDFKDQARFLIERAKWYQRRGGCLTWDLNEPAWPQLINFVEQQRNRSLLLGLPAPKTQSKKKYVQHPSAVNNYETNFAHGHSRPPIEEGMGPT